MMNQRIKNLCVFLLDDENGINQDAYNTLLDVATTFLTDYEVRKLSEAVKAADGRYYLPKGWEFGFTS